MTPRLLQIASLLLMMMLPFTMTGHMEEELNEKRLKVAMRMIGHELLNCIGDYESRVLPVEKQEHQYRISFESEFSFDPSDIISIVQRVMDESKLPNHYLVEVREVNSEALVHSFEIWDVAASNPFAPCTGRQVPKASYELLISIVEDQPIVADLPSADSKVSTLNILIIPFVLFLGFAGFFIQKKRPEQDNPNLILLGKAKFDKIKMTLSIKEETIELSNKEAALLSLLHSAANEPIERETILQKVWGNESNYVGRTVDVFISKLRKKLEAEPSLKIVNIRGVGYKLVMDT